MTNDNIIRAGMGLTPRMREAIDLITAHVGRHGAMPSRRQTAELLGINIHAAVRIINSLQERGHLSSAVPGGPLTGFGGAPITVSVPPDVAAKLAAFCGERGEMLQHVVADAILLHIDAVEAPAELVTGGG